MIQELGIMLCKEREKMGEKQKRVADGILSISELSKMERGILEIDYFTLQALFERLGKSLDKLELAISSDEYEYISYRAEIEQSIAEWDYGKLTQLITGYDACNDERRSIHKQYKTALQAIACYMEEQDYAHCLRSMEQALKCTLHNDWQEAVRSGQRLCSQELRIIMVVAYCLWKLGDTSGLAGHLEQLAGYILHHYTDTEEQVKVYPHCAWLLGQLYLGKDKVEDAYVICRKGKESLIENGSLSPLWEMLRLEEACLAKMGRQAELEQCRRYQKAVAFLYETAGVRVESDMIAAFWKSSFQGEFVITNELVRELREAKGLSQDELCADICAPATLSRIENGKRSPNKKNLYQMLKRMGVDRENYYGFIEADDYELYEKVREYNRCFLKDQREKAVRLLDEIEANVDMTRSVNRQFIGTGRIFNRTANGELTWEQANEQLRELLYLTMPPMDSGTMIYRVPFRMEYTIWNHIAINLREDGKIKEALSIYEALMHCYKKSRVLMRHHAVPGMTLYLNYAGFLEVDNELEKAKEIGMEGLRHDLECCRGDTAGDILANLSLVYGKQGLPDVEETYLRYGYDLICMYDRKDIVMILQ
ncbi:MAG: transcriptional regulator, partial [Lachnospiraceae bacterium]|nr:transcriptional regulator [Lachnospiraceae bacterium]